MIIKIGVPNRGRLADFCTEILNNTFNISLDVKLRTMEYQFEYNEHLIIIYYMRSTDIPYMLEKNVINIGITGNDYFLEAEVDILESNNLYLLNGLLCMISKKNGFCRDRLTCCSQYKKIAQRFFETYNDVEIQQIDGAAETYIRMGLSDCAIDIVTTGITALKNNIKVDYVIMPVAAHVYINSNFEEKNRSVCQWLVEKVSGKKYQTKNREESETYLCFVNAMNEQARKRKEDIYE